MKTHFANLEKAGTFSLTMAILLFMASISFAEECQPIRINQMKGSGVTRIELYPESITVPVGTCTVWINWVTDRNVQISFRENVKECLSGSKIATGFEQFDLKTGESCYISEVLSRGKTSSIVWGEKGEYKYIIEFTDRKEGASPTGAKIEKAAMGTIIVK